MKGTQGQSHVHATVPMISYITNYRKIILILHYDIHKTVILQNKNILQFTEKKKEKKEKKRYNTCRKIKLHQKVIRKRQYIQHFAIHGIYTVAKHQAMPNVQKPIIAQILDITAVYN